MFLSDTNQTGNPQYDYTHLHSSATLRNTAILKIKLLSLKKFGSVNYLSYCSLTI